MPRLSKVGAAALAAFGWTGGASVSASYLVVAGGGGGGSTGGGGGAGGYRTGTASLNPTLSYTVTVGAGGTSASTGNNGGNGGDSVFNAITSTGGGGGAGNPNSTSPNGGSGGGGAYGGVNGTGGSGNTPSTSPSQGNSGGNGFLGSTGGGGGGGASASGTNGSASGSGTGGNGGAGTASTISGSSVTYAGGGGGGGNTTGGTGGAGGGGNGGGGSSSGTIGITAGTANTGGGGGGSGFSPSTSVAGGSGVVIISYAGAQQFGGGVVTTDGTNTIHTFTTSGTLSPLSSLTAQYLIVAGGAGGGGNYHTVATGGGGGAGGLLTGTGLTIDANSNYVVVVGAGGAGGTGGAGTNGVNGTNSTFSMVATAAVGGGYGATNQQAGGNGGSGGGASGPTTSGTFAGGTATSGQGNAGGSANQFQGGGGGGAGAAGASGATGNGGNGLASSISGSSVTYAGGGGQTGGTGGGGSAGVAGTANTGGGGGMGAGGANNAGGAGGSGVVIISYPGSTQQMAGGTVTISGGNVIHTFTSSGYLTPIKLVGRSLRFRNSASAYLNRTPATTGSRQKFTVSMWVKLGSTGAGTLRGALFGGGNNAPGGGTGLGVHIQGTSEGSRIQAFAGGGTTMLLVSSNKYRDPSSWYHMVFSVDTTQSTAANRFRMYVNNQEITSFDSNTQVAQNTSFDWNLSGTGTYLGAYNDGTPISTYFDGYMTEVNAVDGQQLTPSSFGVYNSYGVWQPVNYNGSYGTNGFYLTFGNITSTTTLGYDTSSQGNNWTTNNFSLTAGATYDSMLDVPTLTSSTVNNYCVLNPLITDYTGGGTAPGPRNGNLQLYRASGSGWGMCGSTFGVSSGKWYWEATTENGSGSVSGIHKTQPTGYAQIVGYNEPNGYGYSGDGNKLNNNTGTAYGATYTTGDVIGVALDMDAGTLTFYKNNTSQGVAFSGLSGTFMPAFSAAGPTSCNANFGQQPFTYTPPSGFVALNTYNLSTPTIPNGAVYFAATTYTGTGASLTIANTVNGTNFQPDFVWVKGRSGATDHALYDVLRGTTKQLESNTVTAETTESTGLTAFGSTGFTVGALAQMNTSAATYVAWQWAANGAGVSNTSGTITSTVSVNTTAGFAVVTYTGTGANATVGHGLGVAPSMIIFKSRTQASVDWPVYHISTGNDGGCNLNETAAKTTTSTRFNNTTPTSTVFSVGSAAQTNGSTQSMVAYCFAPIAGYSAFGSYTGNGSTDGPFVYLGFKPRWIMLKKTSALGSWSIIDTSRQNYNVEGPYLTPNLSDAETTGSTFYDMLSNGFKLRASTGVNDSAATYIYAAFAENPFKYSNAR